MSNINRFVFVILVFTTTICRAQDDASDVKPGVRMLGKASKNQIALRWAPNTPLLWKQTLTHGFRLERFTIMRNNALLQTPERKILSQAPIKPWALERWEPLTEQDDYAEIAAQAIYGETFELTEDFSSDITQVYNKVTETENRFSFALFAADQSLRVAEASGLLWTDREVNANEKYLYRIYALLPPGKMKADTGFVYISPSDVVPLPVIVDVQVTNKDKQAFVTWPGKKYDHIYNSFVLERSDDGGKSFHSVSSVPIINATKAGEVSAYTVKADSLQHYNTLYQYRVMGIDAFGEIGPPSAVVSIEAHPALNFSPRIHKTTVNYDGSISVAWEFPQEGRELVKGFRLYHSDNSKNQYKLLYDNLPVDLREAFDKKPYRSNYYIIAAFDQYGNETKSLPAMEMLEDSIPPIPPKHLTGKIDSLGIVSLQWDENKEEDLFGYRVYRSDHANLEYVQVTVHPVKGVAYRDTIELRTLTKQVYYKIIAIDKRFNPSDFSEVVRIERPDIVPPSPPAFKRIQSIQRGIEIEWTNSGSSDVVKEVLYRRSVDDNGWAPIHVFSSADSVKIFTDSLVTDKKQYAYILIAVDGSGLESVPSVPVSKVYAAPKNYAAITSLDAKADRKEKSIELRWNYTAPNVVRYNIYRAEESNGIALYQVIKNNETVFFKDVNLRMNTHYTYRVQAEFANGATSPLSKEVKVNY